MSNSFYYFFSAVPQVMGGILALFGVFIVFKIQAIESNIIGIGQSLLERFRRLNATQLAALVWPNGYTAPQYKRTIGNAIVC